MRSAFAAQKRQINCVRYRNLIMYRKRHESKSTFDEYDNQGNDSQVKILKLLAKTYVPLSVFISLSILLTT